MDHPAPIDLAPIYAAVGHAFNVVVCTIGVQVALHGAILALIIGIVGLICVKQRRPSGKPLLVVCRKLTIFCAIIAIPGVLTLAATGELPPVGHLRLNSFGLFGFWSLIIAHLSMEEMNYQWY